MFRAADGGILPERLSVVRTIGKTSLAPCGIQREKCSGAVCSRGYDQCGHDTAASAGFCGGREEDPDWNRRSRCGPGLAGQRDIVLHFLPPGQTVQHSAAGRRESRTLPLCFGDGTGGVQSLHCLVAEPEQKMRRYWASLFLPAPYVYLHMPQERGKYSLRLLEGVVIISDRDNNILGRRAFAYKSKLSSSRAQRLIAAAAELRGRKGRNQVPLWPRENTPWEWVDADRFELPFTPVGEVKTEPGKLSVSPQLPAGGSENGNRNGNEE